MPKSYLQYKFEDITALGISVKQRNFVDNIQPKFASDFLKMTLEIHTKRLHTTEKEKSEFIIAPILYEIARSNEDKVSFFSGHNLDVDKNLGLKGFCDFLFTKTPESLFISEPIFCIVEAKNDHIERGIPQCIAEMYSAKIFNERKNKSLTTIFGCVTTGYQWIFLKLEQQEVIQDTTYFALNDLPKILGILQYIVES